MISNRMPISVVSCIPPENSVWIFGSNKPNVSINQWDITHNYYVGLFFYLTSYYYFLFTCTILLNHLLYPILRVLILFLYLTAVFINLFIFMFCLIFLEYYLGYQSSTVKTWYNKQSLKSSAAQMVVRARQAYYPCRWKCRFGALRNPRFFQRKLPT